MRYFIQSLSAAIFLTLASTTAAHADISTHVLDIEKGVGSANVPVTLYMKGNNNSWNKLGSAVTKENGRVNSFGKDFKIEKGTYKLTFDMLEDKDAFFPKINVIFNVANPEEHYHVPIIVSPYGYSTYRGN